MVHHLLASKWKDVYMPKVDIKYAFCIIPVHPSDWKWLDMRVHDTYYVHTALCVGCSTSCAIFQSITGALCWMTRQCMDVIFWFLDNSFIISLDHDTALQDLFHTLGVPLATKKAEGPTRQSTSFAIAEFRRNIVVLIPSSCSRKGIHVKDICKS